MSTYIPPHEVIRKFGFLVKGKKPLSGLQFALQIIRSGVDCEAFRKNCASTVASEVHTIGILRNGRCVVKELLFQPSM